MRRAYYHYYHLVHDQNPRKALDGLHLIFVELPKFKPGNLAEKKMQVLWLRFLTEIDGQTRRPPQELVDDPLVNEALEIVEESAYSRGEMLAYDKFWDRMSREAGAERARPSVIFNRSLRKCFPVLMGRCSRSLNTASRH